MNFSVAAAKSSFKKRRTRWIVGTALVLGTATPSFAIFGLGDIVFDPTSYASLISQLSTLDEYVHHGEEPVQHHRCQPQELLHQDGLENGTQPAQERERSQYVR